MPGAALGVPLLDGALLGGGLMGGKDGGGGSADQTSAASNAMAQIAGDLYKTTDPLRKNMVGGFEDFMEGGFDPTGTPMYGAGKQALETQYGTAKESIMSNLPKGGALLNALAGADISKAGDMATMSGNISQDVYNKAYGMATGAPQTAISGYGGAANAMSGLAGQESAGKMGALGDIGLGGGMLLAGK